MSRKRQFDHAPCKECGASFLKKPAAKRFCKRLCKDRHGNRTRGRVTFDTALVTIEQHLMTVADAVKVSGVAETTLRRMIKQGRPRSKRLFGRVLVYRSQIEAMRRSAASKNVTSAARNGVTESAAAVSVASASTGNCMPVEVNAASYDVS